MREHRPRRVAALVICWFVIAPAAFTFAPLSASAQAGLPQLEDASIAPRGLLRLRVATAWTRYESRFASSGLTPLGAPYTADSLGVAQIPDLATTQTAMQSAAGSPLLLSLGRSSLSTLAREEHIPLTLEYGVTSRLQASLMIPVVRKRRTGFLRLDSAGANVGPNPQRFSSTAAGNNALVQVQFASASLQLQQRLQFCTANPSSAGCPALLARQAEAQQVINSSTTFAADVAALYGTTGNNGMAFVPRNQSAAQVAIAARVSAYNVQYLDLLGQTVDILTVAPTGATGPAGWNDIEAYFTRELGRDSLATKELQGVGDYELGATFMAINHAPARAGALRARLAFASSVRFASGTRRAPAGVTDMRIGDGGVGFDARALLDLHRGRLGVFGAASYSVIGSGPLSSPNDADRIGIDVAPRLHLTAPLALHGAWSLRRGDFTGTTQLVGGGVSFTTVNSYRRGARPLPMEMRYSHLEAARGDAGAPRLVRDQLEVRIYFPPRRTPAGGVSP